MTPRIKLLLDCRKVSDGGIGTYLRNLVEGLTRKESIIDLKVLVREEESKNPLLSSIPKIITTSGLYSIRELFCLGREIRWDRFDLFHTPHFVLPFQVNVPSVITIHDLNHIYNPQYFFYPLVAFPYLYSAISRASRIISVSESTFREIERFSGKNRGVMERISIIPNAVSLPKISPPSDRVKERRVDFGSPYLFSIISTDKPHKGIGDLLHVFEYVAQQLPDVRLIIVGRGTPSRDRVPDSLRERVELLGEIESDFLWRLYRCATFVVIPSIKEGFCLPLIEAHAVGVPVVARPIPAILEIATSDDFIADDMSRESFLSAILSALSSKNEGSQRLMDHASNFSVSRITEQTISVYKEAVR